MRLRYQPVDPMPEIKEFLTIYRRDSDHTAIACPCGEGTPHVGTLEIHIRPEFVPPYPGMETAPFSHAARVNTIRIVVCEAAYLKTLQALAEAAELF